MSCSALDAADVMHDRRALRDERAAGRGIRSIAREHGASRNAVRRALAPDARLDYHRPSLSEQFEPAVHDLLADYPRLSVQQIGEIIDWPGSRRSLSDLVARLRPEALAREAEDLNRPVLGRIALGVLTIARVSAGALTVGSVHVGNQTQDPHRAT